MGKTGKGALPAEFFSLQRDILQITILQCDRREEGQNAPGGRFSQYDFRPPKILLITITIVG
jgi:hypothetical protein